MACWIAAPGSVAVALIVIRSQPSAVVASSRNPASGTQLGSAQTMNATSFFGGFAVSGSVCTISVGTAE